MALIDKPLKETIVKRLYSRPVLAALQAQGLSKDELVKSFCNNRTGHVSLLHQPEAEALNKHLYSILQEHNRQQEAVKDLLDRQRKKLIAHLKTAGFTHPATGKADMQRIYSWVETNFKTHLNKMDKGQLSKAIVAAQNVERSTLDALYK